MSDRFRKRLDDVDSGCKREKISREKSETNKSNAEEEINIMFWMMRKESLRGTVLSGCKDLYKILNEFPMVKMR